MSVPVNRLKLETPPRHLVPDVLSPGLDLVFCGTAPSPISFKRRAYYANPGNSFWPTLHSVGLLPERFEPERYAEVLRHGIGLTDLNKTEYGSDHELTPAALDAASVRAKLLAHRPAAVAFTSKNAGGLFFGVRDIGYGRQPPEMVATLEAGLRDIAYFVLSSPSGRARSWWRIEPWQEVAAFVEARRRGAPMISRRGALAGAAAAALARPALGQSGLRMLTDLAYRAAIYAAPIYEMYRRRWRETFDPANPRLLTLNKLDQATALSATAPDTLESSAWLDLSREPMFLTVRDMGGRSYDFAVIDMFGDTFDHVSHRLYGRRPPPHVLFGPSWSNPPPSDVRAIQATTNLVRLAGRIAVEGAGDLAAARDVQTRVLLETPAARNERRILETQELMPAGVALADEPIAGWPELRPDDPWDRLVVAARVLGEGPVPARDASLVAEFAALKLRPGRRFDLLGFSPMERDAMRQGVDAALAEVREAATRATHQVGAWHYPPFHPGDFGDNRLQRAVVATIDPFMPEAAEAITLGASSDDNGAPLDSRRQYALRFTTDGPPQTRAFWSVSTEGRLIGGLRRDDATPVGIMPAGGAGLSAIYLHICQPGGTALDGTWRPPSIVLVE